MVVPKAERLMRGIFHHRVIYDSKLRDERLNMVKRRKRDMGKQCLIFEVRLGGRSFADQSWGSLRSCLLDCLLVSNFLCLLDTMDRVGIYRVARFWQGGRVLTQMREKFC